MCRMVGTERGSSLQLHGDLGESHCGEELLEKSCVRWSVPLGAEMGGVCRSPWANGCMAMGRTGRKSHKRACWAG